MAINLGAAVCVCGVVGMNSKIPFSDRKWIARLLQEGNSCQYVAEEWDVDVSYIYRRLKSWGLDNNGQPLTADRLTNRQQQIYDYIESSSFKLTRSEVAIALGASLDTVDLVCKLKGVALAKVSARKQDKMFATVLLVRRYLKMGISRKTAILEAGITMSEYKHWGAKFNREHKKAPQ